MESGKWYANPRSVKCNVNPSLKVKSGTESLKVESEKWEVESGNWKVESEKWEVGIKGRK